MKKYMITWMLIVAFALCTPDKVEASSYNEETVFDYADLLSEEEENGLRTLSEKYEAYDISAIFLTTSDAEGKSSMVYSDDFYDTNQFRADGVLFMIDMDNREIYVNTVGKCITIITDYDVDRILDAGYTYVSEGEYYNCLQVMNNRLYGLIESYEEYGEVSNYQTYDDYEVYESHSFQDYVAEVLVNSLAVAFVVTLIVVIVLVVKHKKANRRTPAERYMGSNFYVNSKNVSYMGCRQEVLRGYYRENDSSSGSRSGGESRGISSSHRSSRGISHGGGGRKF